MATPSIAAAKPGSARPVPRVSVKGFHVRGWKPTAFVAVPVTEPFYRRGARHKSASRSFLLGEALRFFNYGAREEERSFVSKRMPVLDGDSMGEAVSEFGRAVGLLIYDHVFCLWQQVNLDSHEHDDAGKIDCPRSPAGAQVLQGSAIASNYMWRLANDRCAAALLVPRLLLDDVRKPSYLGRAGPQAVLSLAALHSLFHRTEARLTTFFSATTSEIAGVTGWPDLGGLLQTADWVGSSSTLSYIGQTDASILNQFSPGGSHAQAGLCEKIYATFCLAFNVAEWSGELAHRAAGASDENALFASRAMEAELRAELVKLRPASMRMLEWLDTLREIEDHLLRVARAGVAASGAASAVVRSDLAWGLILANYLRLFLLRACLLTLFAAIPFPALYKGGTLRGRKRSGIVGPMAVALWERLSGARHPSTFQESAGRYPPWFSVIVDAKATEYAIGADPLRPRDSDKLPTLSLLPTYQVPFEDGAPDFAAAERVHAEIALPFRSGEDLEAFSALKALAWSNYHAPRKGEDVARVRIPFPPRPADRFPGDIEENPPFLDDFFVQARRDAELNPTIFTKQTAAESSMRCGAKIGAQLQTYVVSWLYPRGVKESGLLERLSERSLLPSLGITSPDEFRMEFTLNDGSLQYGGKHPAHLTHNNGWFMDWGLWTNVRTALWHTSVQWPMLASKTEEALSDRLRSQIALARSLRPRPKKARTPAQNGEAAHRAAVLTQQTLHSIERVGGHSELSRTLRQRAQHWHSGTPTADWRELSIILDSVQDLLGEVIPVTSVRACRLDELKRTVQDPNPQSSPVYLELCKGALRAIWGEAAMGFRKEGAIGGKGAVATWQDPVACGGWLGRLEQRLSGYPIMPNEDSHLCHHVAHLAVVLSLPPRFLWGAPVYHVRAARAVAVAMAEMKLASPFSPFVKAGRDRHIWRGRFPVMAFFPYNHHHHWHVEYWSRGRKGTHLDHIREYLPFWHMLGVDFAPFIQYLERYRKEPGLRRDAEGLRDIESTLELLESTIALEDADQALASVHATPAQLRAAIFRHAFDGEDQNPIALKAGPSGLITNGGVWPPLGSPLEQLVNRSAKLANSIATEAAILAGKTTPNEVEAALASEEEGERQERLAIDELEALRDLDLYDAPE